MPYFWVGSSIIYRDQKHCLEASNRAKTGYVEIRDLLAESEIHIRMSTEGQEALLNLASDIEAGYVDDFDLEWGSMILRTPASHDGSSNLCYLGGKNKFGLDEEDVVAIPNVKCLKAIHRALKRFSHEPEVVEEEPNSKVYPISSGIGNTASEEDEFGAAE
jgi:hypothetical protein